MTVRLGQAEISKIIASSARGSNTRFLKNAHALWMRFHNYEKHDPYALVKNGNCVCVIFATLSEKTRYVNLYEINTIQGEERKGYASELWSAFIQQAARKGMARIKLSCTPSSVTWHVRNGLVFWSVDGSGSLRSDQPLMMTREAQVLLRDQAILQPDLVMPSIQVRKKLSNENLETQGLSNANAGAALSAIKTVGKYWLRKHL